MADNSDWREEGMDVGEGGRKMRGRTEEGKVSRRWRCEKEASGGREGGPQCM